jgi:hypothetical protein
MENESEVESKEYARLQWDFLTDEEQARAKMAVYKYKHNYERGLEKWMPLGTFLKTKHFNKKFYD